MTEKASTFNGLKIGYSINGVGKTGQIHTQKNETRPPCYILYKNKLKVD